jgi:anthranilate synthase component 1
MTHPTVVTDPERFRATAADAPPDARVPVEVRVPVADPFEAYRRARDGRGGVYFETSGGQPGWGYFGVEPAAWLEAGPNPGIDSPSPSFQALDDLLARETLVRGDCDVPYPCGAFGWLSYDLAREIEDLPETTVDDRGLPGVQVGVYDLLAAWEEPRPEGQVPLRITACPRVPADAELDEIYDRARERALALARRALSGDPAVGDPPTTADRVEFVSESGREAYADRVRRVKEYVRDGDTFQANVSQRLVAPAAVHPVEVFDALRRVNPAPYSALLEFPGVDLVSTSPELLLDVAGDRLLTEPIAGTRPRGATPEEDAALEAELRESEKERAEHAMLVDLERNDLGKVAEYGSVEVSEYRRVDRYSEVMHLVSTVEGRRRDDVTLAEAIAAVFPGGTITGAPKPRTMAIIDEMEDTRRGPYTGSIGVLGFDDRATLNMTIRTLVRTGEVYHLRVGAGIVHDSEPESEYEETMAKGRALVNAVDEALAEKADLAIVGESGEPR